MPGTRSTLAGPLPGGRAGAVARVRPLLGGEMLVPRAGLIRPPGRLGLLRGQLGALLRRDLVTIPVPAFLIEHPAAGQLLVDTGFHADVASTPRDNLGPAFALVGTPRVDTLSTVAVQLAQAGTLPADISAVLMTHLHWDHASALSDYPGAEVVVDMAELAAADRRSIRWVLGYSSAQLDSVAHWRTIDYRGPLAEPLGALSRTVDLFGDGAVRLVSTPGHTAGHQSVLVRTAAGEVLLTGDAAYTSETIAAGALPLLAADMRRFRASLRELREFVGARPELTVVPGHDPGSWPRITAALRD